MLLYTNQDINLIFPDNSDPQSLKVVDCHTILEGIQTENGFCISSLRSTDIKQYLNTKYSPGNIL